MRLLIKRNTGKIEAFNQLNKNSGTAKGLDKRFTDSLIKKYVFSPQRTFYPISGSFQSAVAGNEINTYTNKNLARNMIKLYNSTYEKLIDNGKMLDERWSHISEIYSHERRTNQFNDMDDTQVSKVLDTLYFHFLELEYYQNILISTAKEIDELLLHLND